MSIEDDLHGDGAEREHAKLGMSSAERWASCTASIDACEGLPDNAHDRTRHGSTAHCISEEVLLKKNTLNSYLGRVYMFWSHPESDSQGRDWADELLPGYPEPDVSIEPGLEILHEVTVDEKMLDECATYIKYVEDLRDTLGCELHVEKRMSIEHITKERNAKGTGDAVLPSYQTRTLYVGDAKFGFKKVEAFRMVENDDLISTDGEPLRMPNLQLAGYADAALEEMDPFGLHFDEVVLIIVQPAINHFSEARFTVQQIRDTAQFLRERAEATRTNPQFAPSVEACMFCKAREGCAARDRSIVKELTGGFEDLGERPLRQVPKDELGYIYERLDEISAWVNDKRAQAMLALKSGEPLIGRVEPYKLIPGDQGDRFWPNEAEVVEYLKTSVRLTDEQVFTKKLNGPAKIADLTKKKRGSKEPPRIGKVQWARLEEMMDRKPASAPRIVPMSHPTPAISSAAEGFEDLTEATPAADCADLFN